MLTSLQQLWLPITTTHLLLMVGLMTSCGQKTKEPVKKPPPYGASYFEDQTPAAPADAPDIAQQDELTWEQLIEEIEEDLQELYQRIAMDKIQCNYTMTSITDAMKFHYIYRYAPAPMPMEVGYNGYAKFLEHLDPEGALVDKAQRELLLEQYGPNISTYIAGGDCEFITTSYALYVKKHQWLRQQLASSLMFSQQFTELKSRIYRINTGLAQTLFDRHIAPEFLLATKDAFKDIAARIRRDIRQQYRHLQANSHDFAWRPYEIFLDSFLSSLDPLSGYKTQADLVAPSRDLGLHFRRGDGYLAIDAILPNHAASTSKLRVQDRIIGLICQHEHGLCAGQTRLNLTDIRLDDFLQYLRLKRHDRLELVVLRPRGDRRYQQMHVTLAHLKDHDAHTLTSTITTLTHDSSADLEAASEQEHSESLAAVNIGIIKVPTFYLDQQHHDTAELAKNKWHPYAHEPFLTSSLVSTYTDMVATLKEFNAAKVDGIVLDLRGNSGGPLALARPILSLFIESEHGFQYTMGAAVAKAYVLPLDEPALSHQPLIVLVDRRTASLAELVAQTLKVHARAVIVGDSATAGKSTIQTRFHARQSRSDTRDEYDGAIFQITTGQFFSIDGDSIYGQGVGADVTVPSLTEHLVLPEHHQPTAASFPIKILPARPPADEADSTTLAPIIARLETRSQARRRASAALRLLQRLSLQIQTDTKRHALTRQQMMYQRAWSPLEHRLAQGRLYGHSPQRMVQSIQRMHPTLWTDHILHEATAITHDLIQILRDPTSLDN